jgi:hypothetical protein
LPLVYRLGKQPTSANAACIIHKGAEYDEGDDLGGGLGNSVEATDRALSKAIIADAVGADAGSYFAAM